MFTGYISDKTDIWVLIVVNNSFMVAFAVLMICFIEDPIVWQYFGFTGMYMLDTVSFMLVSLPFPLMYFPRVEYNYAE